MSTFSPSLRIELITDGDQAGTWGNTTNTNLGTIIESSIAGYVTVTTTAQKQALTALDGAADQARNMTLWLETTTGADFEVYAPPEPKLYVVYNGSAYNATVYNSTVRGDTTPAGTGVTIPAGLTVTIWSDGIDFDPQNTYLPGTADDATRLAATNWIVEEIAGYLYFKHNGVNKMRLDSSGNLVVTGNVTAYGTL